MGNLLSNSIEFFGLQSTIAMTIDDILTKVEDRFGLSFSLYGHGREGQAINVN